ncbi:MAG: hypothetical protein J6K61_04205 [Clostridia bacterium]|nr:hypothetical protein [Clostridia bacterium]
MKIKKPKAKEKSPLSVTVEKREGQIKEYGLPLLLFTLSVPLFEGVGSQGHNRESEALYRFLTEKVKALGERIKEAYQKDPSPKKRFTHRPYRLTLLCEGEEKGDHLTLLYTLKLTHKGKNLVFFPFSEVFSRNKGKRVLIFSAKRDKIKKINKKTEREKV